MRKCKKNESVQWAVFCVFYLDIFGRFKLKGAHFVLIKDIKSKSHFFASTFSSQVLEQLVFLNDSYIYVISMKFRFLVWYAYPETYTKLRSPKKKTLKGGVSKNFLCDYFATAFYQNLISWYLRLILPCDRLLTRHIPIIQINLK